MKKRLLCLLLAVFMLAGVMATLASCGDDPAPANPCANGHVDVNGDTNCDRCGTYVPGACVQHMYDNACDTTCNFCNAVRQVSGHVDNNGDSKCDYCRADMATGGGSSDGDDPCANVCAKINEDADGKCDNCGATIRHKCVDRDGNEKCDVCSKKVEKKEEEEEEYPPVAWKDDDPIDLFFMMSHNSDAQQNPSGCQRYLAGEDLNFSQTIDDMVRQRNSKAYEATNVKLKYNYYDDVPEFGWGDCIEIIFKNVDSGSTTAPDMYCNFTYDMVGASLKGSFHNLKNEDLDKGNYFSFLDEDYEESVDNRGYMFEYMESTTLSQHKMYILASDYFIDLVRAFFIVPVNIELLENFGENITGDLNGDGKFTIDDFYEEVKQKKWTYNKVAAYSDAVYQNTGTSNAAEDIEDVLGFALAQGGLAPSGILYSTNITIIEKKWDDTKGDYSYTYPAESPELYELFKNIGTLVTSRGVTYVSSADPNMTKYGSDARVAVRNRFCENQILFGGVIVLGALEYDAYQTLKDDSGFGVVPVPLYHEVDAASSENYLTSIHNNARPGGIARNTSYFSACTAFLDYQSTHSTDILEYYYDYNLQYNVVDGGVEGTVEMLKYIRNNVRSAFDKTFEDAIGVYNAKESIRWHHILSVNAYQYEIRTDYGTYRTEKQGYLNTLYNEYPKLP